MKKITVLLLLTFLLQSCVTNYYYVTVNDDTPVYTSQNNESSLLCTIPNGTGMYIKGKKNRNYRKIKYGNYVGWTYNPKYTSSNYTSTSSKTTNYSTRSSSSNYYTPSSSKTVNVKGYYRKDGTYVKPHTRSAPKRR